MFSSVKKWWRRLRHFALVTWWVIGFQFKSIGVFWTLFLFLRQVFDQAEILVSSYFLGKLINVLVEVYQQGSSPALEQDIRNNVIAMVVLVILSRIIHLDNWLVHIFTNVKQRIYFYQVIHKQVTYLDWSRIEDSHTEKLLRSTLDNGTWPLRNFVNSLMFLMTTAIVFVFAWQAVDVTWLLFLAILIGSIPTGIQGFYYIYRDSLLYDKVLPIHVKLGGIREFFRSFNVIFENKVSRSENYLVDKEYAEEEGIRQRYKKLLMSLLWTNLITITTSIGANVYILWTLVQRVINRTLNVGTFQFYLTTFNKIRRDIAGVFDMMGDLFDAYRYILYSYKFLKLQPRYEDGTKRVDMSRPLSIEFKNVSFRYPKTKNWALKNVSAKIEAGEKVALVGENGAGKSTFVRLLIKAYRPQKGEILINGQNINELSKDSLYQALAIIAQDFARLDVLSVAENIAISDVDQVHKTERIIQAAKQAEAHEFISKLPNKYETVLSKKMEGGTELSTGQWQKIALARLFFANKPLVILDEPTAAIDPVSEYRIFQNIYENIQNKTVVLVSHRYNTVNAADRILVFKDGEIIERGAHQELLSKKGYYHEAYTLQQEQKQI